MSLTPQERQKHINKHNRKAQLEIAQGIHEVIKRIFQFTSNQVAEYHNLGASEDALKNIFLSNWFDAIGEYLINLPADKYNIRYLSIDHYVPIITGVDISHDTKGVINVDISPAHKKLYEGNDQLIVLSRNRLDMYMGGELETIHGGAQSTDKPKEGDVVIDAASVEDECIWRYIITDDGKPALVNDKGDHKPMLPRAVDTHSFVDKNHLHPDRFAVRDDQYGVIGNDGAFIPFGNLNSLKGSDNSADHHRDTPSVKLSDLIMVTLEWVNDNPDKLRSGMVSYRIGYDRIHASVYYDGQWNEIGELSK